MSDSLRDQLLKAGLTTEQDVKRTRTQKKQKGRQQRNRGKGQSSAESEAARRHAEAQAQKRARDRTLNQRREAEKRQQAEEHAARELVVSNEIAHGKDGDIAFNFTHDGRIKKIHVNREQQNRLASGELAIARTRGRFRLIPRAVAERVRPRAPFLVAYLADPDDTSDPEYAEHPVPDDLMW